MATTGGVTFHDLRHTFASLMIASGANPLQIAEAPGHTDRKGQPDATLVWRRYRHLYPGSDEAGGESAWVLPRDRAEAPPRRAQRLSDRALKARGKEDTTESTTAAA